MDQPKTIDAARGKWPDILNRLGVNRSFLTGRHCPCPACGGKDRFRFDNQDGSGSFICGQCGAGYGLDLLMRINGWDFAEAARQVDLIVDNCSVAKSTPRPKVQTGLINRMWNAAEPVSLDNLAGQYYAGRDCLPDDIPSDLRFHPSLPVPYENENQPAILAAIRDMDGNAVNLQRVFLKVIDGTVKTTKRAFMPGEIPDGSAVRLSPICGDHMGIGEGSETCMRAELRFLIPVWAALNSALLKTWWPPEGIKRVSIFGDNDTKFGGQAATYHLAHRLAVKGIEVIPSTPGIKSDPAQTGLDWADEMAA